MSDSTSTTKVNSELPDEDALGAFAANAFAGPRRRRDKPRGSDTHAQPVAKTDLAATAPAVKETPAEKPAPAPDRTEPHAPAPTSTAEVRPAHDIQLKPAPAPVPPEPVKAPAEVQVRTAPITHTPSPLPERNIAPSGQVQVPDLGPTGARATQCTIMVSANVRDRIAHYQLTKKMETGKEPTNSVVVRRAFLNTRRHDLFHAQLLALHHRQNPVDDEDYDDDGILGEVVGRRAERGRMKDSQQQSFRPSYQELATYDAFSTAYGFPSRSDFLDSCLDTFLPAMPSSGRRK